MAGRRSRARYLAPIALIATIAGTYAVAHTVLTTKSKSAATQTSTAASSPSSRHYAKVKFYVVKSGDSLTSIASKTGVAITTLEALNPKVDPNSLQTGQRVRLRR
jgi:LysM repeat protein